jgi:hypothetical protein
VNTHLAVTINVLHNRDYKEMQDEMELQKTRRNKTIKNVVVATKQGRDVYERQLLRHWFMVFQSDLAPRRYSCPKLNSPKIWIVWFTT